MQAGGLPPHGRLPRSMPLTSPRVLLMLGMLGTLTAACAGYEYQTTEDTAEGQYAPPYALQSRRLDDDDEAHSAASASAAPSRPPACARLMRRDAVTGRCVARRDLPRCVEGAFPTTTPLTITRDAVGGDGQLAVADFTSGERGYLDRLRWKQLAKPPRVLNIAAAVRPPFPNRAAKSPPPTV